MKGPGKPCSSPEVSDLVFRSERPVPRVGFGRSGEGISPQISGHSLFPKNNSLPTQSRAETTMQCSARQGSWASPGQRQGPFRPPSYCPSLSACCTSCHLQTLPSPLSRLHSQAPKGGSISQCPAGTWGHFRTPAPPALAHVQLGTVRGRTVALSGWDRWSLWAAGLMGENLWGQFWGMWWGRGISWGSDCLNPPLGLTESQHRHPGLAADQSGR